MSTRGGFKLALSCAVIILILAAALTAFDYGVVAQVPTEKFDRAAFLEFLAKNPEPASDQLRAFYTREGNPPLREPRWEDRRKKLEKLGAQLFFDPRLSDSGQMSCSTCHNPVFHWTDRLPVSTENASRRSMSLYNLAWDKSYLWNGRAGSLMQQAILALTATKGMHAVLTKVPEKLSVIPGYRKAFGDAFGLKDSNPSLITFSKVATALEVFQSGITSPPSSFDRWVDGDERAISDQAKRGFMLFNGKAQCAQCHNSWRFSDGRVYNTGLASQCVEAKEPNTPKSWNHGLFKAVGLREIEGRAPYMHDGTKRTLEEVVEFYNRGGDAHCDITDARIKPLGLSSTEVQDLVSFLGTLGEGSKPYLVPELPN